MPASGVTWIAESGQRPSDGAEFGGVDSAILVHVEERRKTGRVGREFHTSAGSFGFVQAAIFILVEFPEKELCLSEILA
jgi:hypothetical protein